MNQKQRIRLLPKSFQQIPKNDRLKVGVYFICCGMLIGAGEIMILIALGV